MPTVIVPPRFLAAARRAAASRLVPAIEPMARPSRKRRRLRSWARFMACPPERACEGSRVTDSWIQQRVREVGDEVDDDERDDDEEDRSLHDRVVAGED